MDAVASILVTNLRAIDLNLVVALDALLAERNVTRAAKRIAVSQPAMSHALAKLRELLDDPLLVRVGRHMVLTERAEALVDELPATIARLAELFGRRPTFDPATSTRQFSIAATDYVQFVLLPELDALLRREAPGVSIAVSSLPLPAMADALRAGTIDLAAALLIPDWGSDLHTRELFQDRFVGLARKDHPRVRRSMSRAAYAALSHVVVSPQGSPGGVVDSVLAGSGMSRTVSLSVPQFLIAPHIVARSDHVVTIAERVARPFTRLLPLRIFHPPIDLPPMTIGAIWHGRTADEPAQQWFRATIERVAARLARQSPAQA